MPQTVRLCIAADAAIDPRGTITSPAWVVVELSEALQDREGRWTGRARVLSVTSSGKPAADVHINRAGCVVTPGFVNAHTHLDLTHIGPQPFDASQGFMSFVDRVIANRLVDAHDITRTVAHGAELSLRGGVVAVGDIAGVVAGGASMVPVRALEATPLWGKSFMEFFACGPRETASLERLHSALEESRRSSFPKHILGISPHAPYSVSRSAYLRARDAGLSLCTHLAENPEERAFVARGEGVFRDFLERFGLWNDDVARDVGLGLSPIEHMREVVSHGSWLLAHVNDASDSDIALLARAGASVVYCPRSSAYFGNHNHFGPHRYKDMLKVGLNVCLGTDSVINLPDASRISTFDEARLLVQRDNLDPLLALQMITTHGARALGLSEAAFSLEPGAIIAGFVATPVSALSVGAPGQLLASAGDPELLVLGRRETTSYNRCE
jgi:cytosine/adenosine deaminase-related metal-dependent hydrolase